MSMGASPGCECESPGASPIMDDIWGQGRMSSVYTRFWGFCSIYCPYTIRFMGRVLEVVARLHLQ